MSDYGNNERNCKGVMKGLREVDMFNKDITLYYKGNDQSNTLYGSILTIIYITAYFTFFVYKIIRMFKKIDISIYESEILPKSSPSIQLTSEIFYPVFTLTDPIYSKPILDETIYIPKAYFKRRTKGEDNEYVWEEQEIEVEQCKIEKFGAQFRDKFPLSIINNSYCLKDINFLLEGTESTDVYSYFLFNYFLVQK